MNGPFRAHIIDDYSGFARQTVRLVVVSDQGDQHQVLMADGTWRLVELGAVPDGDAGIEIPREAVEALLAAIERWQGRANHGATEAAVLREWLVAERTRVDQLIGLREALS